MPPPLPPSVPDGVLLQPAEYIAKPTAPAVTAVRAPNFKSFIEILLLEVGAPLYHESGVRDKGSRKVSASKQIPWPT
jgi:hypothetical protein